MFSPHYQDDEPTLDFTFNTLRSPYKVDFYSPTLLPSGLGSDRAFVVLDYQPGSQLTAETSYRQLKIDMRTEKSAEGRKFFAEMWREGEKNINYDLDVQYQEVNISHDHLSYKYSSVRPMLRSTSTRDPILTSNPSLFSTQYSVHTAQAVSGTESLRSTSSLTTTRKTGSSRSSV